MPKVVAVTSEKGGVGKSTLAVHLSGALAERGLKVGLIDEDPRVGSSYRWAQRGLAVLGEALPFDVWEADAVKPKKLAALDVVVVDTEGRPKRKELRQLADRADVILVPSGTSALELEATLELMAFLQADPDAARRARVVLTRVPPVGRAGEEARVDLREAGITVCNTLVRAYAAYGRAAELGTLARDVRDPRALAAWEDMLSLSREIV